MAEIIIRKDATADLKIKIGDRVCNGRIVSTKTNSACEQLTTLPISGIIKSIRFDGNSHEFIIVVSIQNNQR
ncbi:MAG: hypothetical protein KAS69_07565 [Planctomycetes bacterium]|nr:hypothetical protein [Planctomycetota bacterium]